MKILRGCVVVVFAALVFPLAGLAKPQNVTLISVQQSQHVNGNVAVIKDTDCTSSSCRTKLGHDTLTCNTQTSACTVSAYLSGGRVDLKFTAHGSSGTGTVAGGTGTYKGAMGSFAWKNLNKQGTLTQVSLTFM